MDADVIVVGAGIAGLEAAHELTARGKRVALVDQENENNLGGQAFWSLGGLFLVNSPEQRFGGIRDSVELAWDDWQGSAQFDRVDDEDRWAVQWARAFVDFAAGEMRSWLRSHHMSFLPNVGWAERGGLRAGGHGNSVPRFHIAWGSGPGVVGPFVGYAAQSASEGLLHFYYRHQVDGLVVQDGAVRGVHGTALAEDAAPRGVASSRKKIGEFELLADAVILTAGGIGGNHDLVRQYWPERLGRPPSTMLTGVPAYVDGRALGICAEAGARVVNRDRMWHYTEGVSNWAPIWPGHGVRILPGPSSMWFDAFGRRLPDPCLPGYDTLSTLRYLRTTPDLAGYDHSWLVLTQKIIEKEIALSGSEQNPDISARDPVAMIRARLRAKGAPGPVEAFKHQGADFVVASTLEELVSKMNELTREPLVDVARVRRQIGSRDLQVDNPFGKDSQVQGIWNSRRYMGERLLRTAAPHKFLDPANGPLIGIRLHVLTRKTLGGIQTDLQSRALGTDGHPISGLFAAGELAGFGGGGLHGYNSLEGSFLGGSLFSGRVAGRAVAGQV